MATGSKKFQAPKGTRDFYPQDMAVRRYIEGVWRTTSINHGFDEIEGPMFEDLDLYTHKSGPGIVSELFQVYSGKDKAEIEQIQKSGQAPLALRPEFTPTLARMVAAKAAELPRPIKWFAIPQHFRAERPQRGRLREFLQWNVDFIGDESVISDVEILSCSIDALQQLGLTLKDVKIRYADREVVKAMLERVGISAEATEHWMLWIDKYDKLDSTRRIQAAREFGGTEQEVRTVELLWSGADAKTLEATKERAIALGKEHLIEAAQQAAYETIAERLRPAQRRKLELERCLELFGIADWCVFDAKIVRGLAYYTGLVFEIHEATGEERAIAGGGRYDNLIESFGGPKLPACGFGMGDVVLGNLLHDKGLLPQEVYMKPLRPHAFAIAANDEAEPKMRQTVAALRREGFHVRHSYKTTRNVGKLLGDASKSRAMTAIIFGKESDADRVDFKDLDSQSQGDPIAIDEIAVKLKEIIRRNDESK